MLDEVKAIFDLIDVERKRYSDALDVLHREHSAKLEHLKSKLLKTPHCKYSKGDYVDVASGFGFTVIVGKICDVIIDDSGTVKYRIKPIDSDLKELPSEFNDLDNSMSSPIPEYSISKIHDIKAYFGKVKKTILLDILEDADSESRSYRDKILREYIKKTTDIKCGDLVEVTTENGVFDGRVHQILVSESSMEYGEIKFMVDTTDSRSLTRFIYGTILTTKKKEV